MKVIVKYYEDEDVYHFLQELARYNGKKFSELMREIVREGLLSLIDRGEIKVPKGLVIEEWRSPD